MARRVKLELANYDISNSRGLGSIVNLLKAREFKPHLQERKKRRGGLFPLIKELNQIYDP